MKAAINKAAEVLRDHLEDSLFKVGTPLEQDVRDLGTSIKFTGAYFVLERMGKRDLVVSFEVEVVEDGYTGDGIENDIPVIAGRTNDVYWRSQSVRSDIKPNSSERILTYSFEFTVRED